VRGSCYSGAKEPLYRSSYHGCSQEIVARWFEERKKRWHSRRWQEGLREKVVLEEIILQKICFSQIHVARNARSRSQECRKKRSGAQERRSQIRWSQVVSETLESSKKEWIEAGLIGSEVRRSQKRKQDGASKSSRGEQGRFGRNEASALSRGASQPGCERSCAADCSRRRIGIRERERVRSGTQTLIEKEGRAENSPPFFLAPQLVLHDPVGDFVEHFLATEVDSDDVSSTFCPGKFLFLRGQCGERALCN
jgi:hypothetical protein